MTTDELIDLEDSLLDIERALNDITREVEEAQEALTRLARLLDGVRPAPAQT